MKAYKVEIEKLDWEWGRFQGYETIGYYANEEEAKRVADEAYANRCKVDTGNTKITEVEINLAN